MEDLISILVEELYGADPSKVARNLHIRKKSSFKSLLDATGLDDQSLRNALVILIQQQLVSYEDFPKQVYSLIDSEVLLRIRYPRYIRCLYARYGEYCPIEDVLENGCCSIAQLLDSARECWDSTDPTNNIIRDMISSDYLLPLDRRAECKDSIDTTPNKKKAGEPRKKLKLTMPSETIVSTAVPPSRTENFANGEQYYRLNFAKLNRELVAEMVSSLVSSKTNLNCAVIAENMYKLGYRGVTRSEIAAALPVLPKISLQVLEVSLELLENKEIVLRESENTWKLNLPLITNILCNSALEQVILGRFGDYSTRVFRILCNKGSLDDKTISELTLLPLRETHISLNELFTAGFVYKRAMGVAQEFYGIKVEEVKQEICTQSYRSVFNLKVKLNSEMEEVWGLIQRVGFLSSEEKQALEKYKHIESRIESAILELDRTIMIFSSEY